MTETPEKKAARLAERERVPTQEEIDQAIEDARRPALLLNKTKFPDDPGEPGCWLGGAPTLPPDIEWPYHEVEGVMSPLYFVTQINLTRVQASISFPSLPDRGTLFFFYDPMFLTFHGKVIYVEEDVSICQPRRMPSLPGPEDFLDDPSVHGLAEPPHFSRWNFDFLDFDTFRPDLFRNRILEQHIGRARQDAIDNAGEETVLGWASSEDGASSEMSMHHLFGSQSDLRPPDGEPLLLLKIYQDKDVGIWDPIFWYFWIPKDALSALNFDEVFMTNE